MTSRTIKSYECESSSSTLQASLHFDHTPLSPSFYALVSTSNIAWVGLITCGYWEVVDEVGTYSLHSNLGSYYYVMLILPCYSRRRGLGLSVSMTDVRLLMNGST